MAEALIQVSEKICTICKFAKAATGEFFNRHKLGVLGLNPVCKACRKIEGAEYRARPGVGDRYKAWRAANADIAKEHNKKFRESGKKAVSDRIYRQANIEGLKIKAAAKYQRSDKDLHRAKNTAWREANKEKANGYAAAYYRRIYAECGQQAVSSRMSVLVKASIRLVLKSQSSKAGKSWRDIVGYGPIELITHLERQFTGGMTWKNMGQWHIDHIQPVSSFKFLAAGDQEFRACWAMSNLRPLWAGENIRKGAKRLFLL